MRSAALFETVLGVVVVAAAVAFLAYAYSVSARGLGADDYELTAVFGRVDGVSPGADVRIAGVSVGSVRRNRLNPDTYEAQLTLAIDDGVKVPEDSAAKIVSDGLLGGAHVAIEPGGSIDYLLPGDAIVITQGSVDLLGLAVQAFTSSGGNGGGEQQAPAESDDMLAPVAIEEN